MPCRNALFWLVLILGVPLSSCRFFVFSRRSRVHSHIVRIFSARGCRCLTPSWNAEPQPHQIQHELDDSWLGDSLPKMVFSTGSASCDTSISPILKCFPPLGRMVAHEIRPQLRSPRPAYRSSLDTAPIRRSCKDISSTPAVINKPCKRSASPGCVWAECSSAFTSQRRFHLPFCAAKLCKTAIIKGSVRNVMLRTCIKGVSQCY